MYYAPQIKSRPFEEESCHEDVLETTDVTTDVNIIMKFGQNKQKTIVSTKRGNDLTENLLQRAFPTTYLFNYTNNKVNISIA